MTMRAIFPLISVGFLNACGSAPSVDETTTDDVRSLSQGLGRNDDDRAAIRVLLLSVDGMHQVDLTNWIATHPDSNLAKLSATGVEYRDAHTPTPSDSFPGLAALVTGGTAAR